MQSIKRRKSRHGSSWVRTPYKNELEENQNEKERKTVVRGKEKLKLDAELNIKNMKRPIL